MLATVTIRKLPGTYVVRADGAVIGESQNVLELTEGTLAPVLYFPRADLAMAFLDPSARRDICPLKGAAEHFTIATQAGALADAAWSYASPPESLARLAGHIAFDTGRIAVERL